MRRKRHIMPLVLSATLSACSDGYSSAEGELMLRNDMGLEGALAALNRLGHDQPSDYHWDYALLPNCELEIRKRRMLFRQEPIRVSLRGAVSDKKVVATGRYEVMLRSSKRPAQTVVVLDHMDAVDATQVEWLLDYLPRFCTNPQSTNMDARPSVQPGGAPSIHLESTRETRTWIRSFFSRAS